MRSLNIYFFTVISFLAASLSLAADTSRLNDIEDTCDYYLHLEQERNCMEAAQGRSNYLVNFGHKYCEKYRRQHWRGELASWTIRTRTCLINELKLHQHEYEMCTDLENFAFASHTKCYVESGFCSLSTVDKMAILCRLERHDLMSKAENSIVQALSVVESCVDDIDLTTMSTLYCGMFN